VNRARNSLQMPSREFIQGRQPVPAVSLARR